MASFPDHFSGVADAYAAARPEYPESLYEILAAAVPATARIWEPGCGSGQATRGLVRFGHVHATDPSPRQLAGHWAHDASQPGANRTTFAPEPAERTSLADASVDLIAVAQALHWFDRESFFGECQRVLVPGGVLAAWGYQDFLAPEGMVEEVSAFRARIEPHWPPQRVDVDAQYAGYDWPFPALPAPPLWLEAEWSLAQFLRYLSSMSASARCQVATGDDPVARHASALAAAWGGAGETRVLKWPLFLHLRRRPT